jgi:GTP:adenosylcobinamide-phosphate guanylyltransferase
MAGGKATRMGGVEKPIAMLKGRPMIAYVIDALLESSSVGRIFIAVSHRVPATADYLKKSYSGPRIAIVETPGEGYHEDTVRAVEALDLRRPFLITSADVPLITPEVVDEAIARYMESGAEALSVRLDISSVPSGLEPDTVLTDSGSRTVPAGINIMDGRHMDRYQEELIFVVPDGRLAVNVNYGKDLAIGEKLLGNIPRHRQV